MRKRSFAIGALSEIGYVKRTNQDRILIKIGEDQFGEFGLFVVADGMGGLTAGDRASEIVVTEFKSWWNHNLSIILGYNIKFNIDVIDKELDKLILDINKKVIEFGKAINNSVGTTLTMLFIYRNQYIIKHIGDSRIYKINKDIEKLTEDHSWIAKQVREGKINEKEAVNHPRRHILLQCIGIKETLDVFNKKGEVADDDMFLVCSDGFYNLLLKNEILDTIQEFKENNEDIQNKVVELMKKVKSRGAADNASVILIEQNFSQDIQSVFKRIMVRWRQK